VSLYFHVELAKLRAGRKNHYIPPGVHRGNRLLMVKPMGKGDCANLGDRGERKMSSHYHGIFQLHFLQMGVRGFKEEVCCM